MNHRPVCVKCGVEMRCKTNGVEAHERYAANPEKIYRIWRSDEYECSVCGITILCGFGKDAYTYDDDEDFPERLERARAGRYVEYIR